MFLYPWYSAFMLAAECNNVIDIRLRKIANGDLDAAEEAILMVNEKISAAMEAGSMLLSGKGGEVIEFYRMHVAANAARLN